MHTVRQQYSSVIVMVLQKQKKPPQKNAQCNFRKATRDEGRSIDKWWSFRDGEALNGN